jgi:hypothetical protein
VRDRLQAAGTYHVIAISGGNIAIFVALVAGLCALCGLGPQASSLVTIAPLAIYAGIVVSGPSVRRAVLVAVVYLVSRALDHRTGPGREPPCGVADAGGWPLDLAIRGSSSPSAPPPRCSCYRSGSSCRRMAARRPMGDGGRGGIACGGSRAAAGAGRGVLAVTLAGVAFESARRAGDDGRADRGMATVALDVAHLPAAPPAPRRIGPRASSWRAPRGPTTSQRWRRACRRRTVASSSAYYASLAWRWPVPGARGRSRARRRCRGHRHGRSDRACSSAVVVAPAPARCRLTMLDVGQGEAMSIEPPADRRCSSTPAAALRQRARHRHASGRAGALGARHQVAVDAADHARRSGSRGRRSGVLASLRWGGVVRHPRPQQRPGNDCCRISPHATWLSAI